MSVADIRILLVFLALGISVGWGKPPRKINSGANALYREFPHQVSLRVNGVHICGGSIIHKVWILTAAHCVVEEPNAKSTNIEVLSGTNNQQNTASGQIHKVISILYHENYHSSLYANDIALLKLRKPMIFSDVQKPIALASYDLPIGTPVTFSGWGSRAHNTGMIFQKLQKLNTFIISNQECQIRDGHFIIGFELVCTRKGMGYSICQGDSGGPLIHNNVLIGIAARSECDGIHPDIFTRVAPYIKWISNIMANY